MTEAEFNELLDELMVAIEDAIDELEIDIDCESGNGMLTMQFENHSQIILSRQPALRQLWLAAKSGGFHFNYQSKEQQPNEQQWVCDSTGEEFISMLNRFMTEQGGEEVELELG
ncbi:iron donor protein CyaY [Endozoicomonas sp. SM1973]|uniref:Iron-sulfur cluster assembly protein CyaY n=1 Tax=Spartinivicinus marinus TaxID=2994442 RepID=A0A853IAZ6_9GAMM|nr:iron donor protein CyaY [Spartinivicinus marinus]MCX4027410.1 iron donor protein CyaY [Spartinivicinus marinus]NYZ66415.1 iron donor protein CyaY [Spartinivicinus marinus]